MSRFAGSRCPMGMNTVILVGAGYAGMMVAHRALRRGHAVTLVSERQEFVERVRLHEVVAGTRTPASVQRPIRLPRGGEVVTARVARVGEGWVELADGRRLEADHVVLATGSGAGNGGWDWAMHHREAVASLGAGQRMLVRGAGLTGIEVATEIADQRPDLDVTVVDPQPLGAAFSPRGREGLMASFGRLRLNQLETADDGDFDHVIECTGFRRELLATDSGLPVSEQGAVLVDEHLRVQGFTRLWACGDAADLSGWAHLRMACATALPMAAHVADQLGRVDRGQALAPFDMGYLGWCLSLGRRDGLFQYVRRDDAPGGVVLGGRTAVVTKELICRFAVAGFERFSGVYRGLEGPRAG